MPQPNTCASQKIVVLEVTIRIVVVVKRVGDLPRFPAHYLITYFDSNMHETDLKASRK